MQRFDWSITAFNFGEQKDSYKLKVEEAEDGLSMTVEMLKAVRHTGAPESVQKQVEDIAQELFGTLDKLRMLRTNMKSMT